jgi:hypothetical protein
MAPFLTPSRVSALPPSLPPSFLSAHFGLFPGCREPVPGGGGSASLQRASHAGCKYQLYAVLVHLGSSLSTGHYISYIRASNGLWYCMDDASVSLACSCAAEGGRGVLLRSAALAYLRLPGVCFRHAQARQTSLQHVLQQNAYLLFYRQLAAPTLSLPPKPGAAAPKVFSTWRVGGRRVMRAISSLHTLGPPGGQGSAATRANVCWVNAKVCRSRTVTCARTPEAAAPSSPPLRCSRPGRHCRVCGLLVLLQVPR